MAFHFSLKLKLIILRSQKVVILEKKSGHKTQNIGRLRKITHYFYVLLLT
jgi:hypothetical protein